MRKPKGYWNYENCYEEALKYKTRTEFQKGSPRAYDVALKKGWLDDYTWFVDGKMKLFVDKIDSVYKYVFEDGAIYIGRTLMNRQKQRNNEHQTDAVGKYAKEHNLEIPQMVIIEDNLTVTEGLEREDYWINWYKEKGYNVLNKAKTGVGSGSLGRINSGKWNKETCYQEALKYKRRNEFQKGCASAYHAARKHWWLDDYTWFEELYKPNGYWNKENVFEEAKKYKTKKEFYKGCASAYESARKNKWIKEMNWFEEVKKPKGYWDIYENVFEETRKYKTKIEFRKSNNSAYNAAWKNDWLDILFPVKKVA